MNYILEYTVLGTGNKAIVYMGKIKVKNRSTEQEAKDGLMSYIKNKYPNFVHITIHSCRPDKDKVEMPDFFKDIFK